MKTVLVTGAGGFIGGYLVKALLDRGDCWVRAVSSRPIAQWLQVHPCLNEGGVDLQTKEACEYSVAGCDEVYNLAAKVGGIGYIEKHKVDCALSSLINTHLLMSCVKYGVRKYFFASSACVYPNIEGPIKESQAYPGNPSAGYGWEKLFSEQMCEYFREERSVQTCIGRFFTCYGPNDNLKGVEGKHHVPSALCAKVAWSKLHNQDSIEIWGDGTQRRNFLYVDDAVKGSMFLMDDEVAGPVNIGGTEQVSVNELLDIIEDIAGTKLRRVYLPTRATGVHERNSDNTLILEKIGWEPSTPLRTGLELTYRAIWDKLAA